MRIRERWKNLSTAERAAFIAGAFSIAGVLILVLGSGELRDDSAIEIPPSATATTAPFVANSPTATKAATVAVTPTLTLTATYSASLTPSTTATLTDEQTVSSTIRAYFEFFSSGNHQGAYDLLHPQLKKEPGFSPYDEWLKAVADTVYVLAENFPTDVEVRGNLSQVDFAITIVPPSAQQGIPVNASVCLGFIVSDNRWYIRQFDIVSTGCFDYDFDE